jgi:hypothetical protein
MASKILKALPTIILGAIMFAAGTSPDSAVSNISKWADFLHINIPNALRGKTADVWIFWICLTGIVLYVIIMASFWLFRRKNKKELKKKVKIATPRLEQSDFITRLKYLNVGTTTNDYVDIRPIGDQVSQTIDGKTLITKWGTLRSNLLNIVKAQRIIALTPDEGTNIIANKTEQDFEENLEFYSKENEIDEDTVLHFRFRPQDIREFERKNELLKHRASLEAIRAFRNKDKKEDTPKVVVEDLNIKQNADGAEKVKGLEVEDQNVELRKTSINIKAKNVKEVTGASFKQTNKSALIGHTIVCGCGEIIKSVFSGTPTDTIKCPKCGKEYKVRI